MATKQSKVTTENQNPSWEAATNASCSEIAPTNNQPHTSDSTSGPSSASNMYTEASGDVDDSLRLYADREDPPNHSTTSVISNVSYTNTDSLPDSESENSERNTKINLEIALLIRKLYGPAAKFPSNVSLEQKCKNHILEWSMENESLEEASLLSYIKIITDFTMGTNLIPEEDHKMAKILASKLPRNCEIRNLFKTKTRLELVNGYDSVLEAVIRLKCLLSEKREYLRVYKEFGPDKWESVVPEKDKAPTSNVTSGPNPRASSAPAQTSQKDQKCNSCGVRGHIRIRCMWVGHPLSNKTYLPWDFSPMGIVWKNSGVENMVPEHRVQGYALLHKSDARPYNNNPKKSMAHHHLDADYNNNKRNYSTQNSNNQSSNSHSAQPNQTDNSPSVKTAYNNEVKKARREFQPDSVCSTVIIPSSDEYLTVSLSLLEQMTTPLAEYQDTACQPPTVTTQGQIKATSTRETAPTPAVKCLALIETGSIAGNFINSSLLNKLNGTD